LINLIGKEEANKVQNQLKNPEKNSELLELESYIQKLNTNKLGLVFDPFITR